MDDEGFFRVFICSLDLSRLGQGVYVDTSAPSLHDASIPSHRTHPWRYCRSLVDRRPPGRNFHLPAHWLSLGSCASSSRQVWKPAGSSTRNSNSLDRDGLCDFDLPVAGPETASGVKASKVWTDGTFPDWYRVGASNCCAGPIAYSFHRTCIVSCIRYSTLFYPLTDPTCEYP